NIVAIVARRAGRPFLRRLAHLIIDSNTAVRRLTESPPSVSKASTSRRSLESTGSAGTQLIAGWRAAACCRRVNNRKIKGFSIPELQADEIRTIVGNKEQPIWVFVVIEVWSRLWPSTAVGKRSYHNTRELFRNLSNRMHLESIPLITSDGFKFYERVVGRV